MARNTKDVTITAEGRDKGKVFHLTEMPATQSEKWAFRLFLALSRAGFEVPDDIQAAGMAGIAALGLQSIGKLSWADAEPLIDEMFGCVQVVPDPSRPEVIRRLIESDIEEIGTRMFLRKEIFGLHVSFSTPAKA